MRRSRQNEANWRYDENQVRVLETSNRRVATPLDDADDYFGDLGKQQKQRITNALVELTTSITPNTNIVISSNHPISAKAFQFIVDGWYKRISRKLFGYSWYKQEYRMKSILFLEKNQRQLLHYHGFANIQSDKLKLFRWFANDKLRNLLPSATIWIDTESNDKTEYRHKDIVDLSIYNTKDVFRNNNYKKFLVLE